MEVIPRNKYMLIEKNSIISKLNSNLCNENQDIIKNYVCSFCFHVDRKPIQCHCCEILFCHDCVSDLSICPTCSQNFIADQVGKRAIQTIGSFKFKCPNHVQGCETLTTLDDVGTHMINCKYTLRIAKCFICQMLVDTTNEMKEINEHVKTCEETEIVCDSCEKKVKRKFMSNHKNKDCDYHKITCDMCKNTFYKKNLSNHLREVCLPGVMGVLDHEYEKKIKMLNESFRNDLEEVKRSMQSKSVPYNLNYFMNKLKPMILAEEIKFLSENYKLLKSKEQVDVIFQIKWTKNDTSILSLSEKSIKIWRIETSECLQSIEKEKDSFMCAIQIKWDIDDSTIAVGTGIKFQIKLYNIETGSIIKILKKHSDAVVCLRQLKWNRDKSTIASGSRDSTIKLWNINNSECIFTLTGHTSPVHSLIQMKPDSEGETLLISRGDDKEIRVWDIEKAQCKYNLVGHTSSVFCHLLLKLSKNTTTLASGCQDGLIAIWNVQSGICINKFQAHSTIVHSIIQMIWNKNESTIVSASQDKTIKLWNFETGECLKVLKGHSNNVSRLIQIKFEIDDRIIASTSNDTFINLWNVETGEILGTLNQHTKPINSIIQMKWKSDALCLISAGNDKKVFIWGHKTNSE